MGDVVLAIDQGTSGTTCLLVDVDSCSVVRRSHREVSVSYPEPGWVEQDAEALLASVIDAAGEVLAGGAAPAAIGLTNQRETVVVADRRSLEPLAPAIVWQCRRTAPLCERHRAAGHEPEIRRRTGLLLDPYFTATKIEWLLREYPEVAARAATGDAVALTIDAWLVARLSGGATVTTDPSNASRTLLYDLRRGSFDSDLCALFGIPPTMLPEIRDSAGPVGVTDPSIFHGRAIAIAGVAGDQQAALFGQACLRSGMAKNTYGTGSFVLMTVGPQPLDPGHGLLSTVAWRLRGRDTFALEGSIFVTGAALRWLRDQLGLIADVGEAGPLFDSVPDSGGCHFVPALVGLGAPFWDPAARGALLGLTPSVTRAHVVRAVVEAMALRTRDVVEAMEAAGAPALAELRVDGGASVMDGLCQFQSDLLGIPVARASSPETTGLGAAMLAAVGQGLADGPGTVAARWVAGRRFEPARPDFRPQEPYAAWRAAVDRVRVGPVESAPAVVA